MQSLKIVIVSAFIILSSASSHAQWGAITQYAGFLGKYAVGPTYDFNDRHMASYLLGGYQIDKNYYYQSSLLYRYSRWTEALGDYNWRPLQIGLFMTYAMNNTRFFTRSPSIYPAKNYYEQTKLRYGVEVGTDIAFKKYPLNIGIYMRWLDVGLVALFNNQQRDQQFYFSSAVSLQYKF